MPEIIEDPKTKKKQLVDWAGRVVTPGQEAVRKDTEKENYLRYHIAANLPRDLSSKDRASELTSRINALQKAYPGLGGDYVKAEADVDTEKMRGQAARDVAQIQGEHLVEATKAGNVPTPSQGSSFTDPFQPVAPLKLADDTPVIGEEERKKQKEKQLSIAQNIALPSNYSPIDISTAILPEVGNKGISSSIFSDMFSPLTPGYWRKKEERSLHERLRGR